MSFQSGDRVEVTSPQPGFEHRVGETGTVTRTNGHVVHIEDEDGHQSAHYPHELTAR